MINRLNLNGSFSRENVMPFCPKCGFEYKENIVSCADCGEDLVDTLPRSGNGEGNPDNKFVPLPNLPGRIYGEMLKEALIQKGIPSYIRSDGFSDTYQVPGTLPLGGVRLYVPEDKLEVCLHIQRGMMDHI